MKWEEQAPRPLTAKQIKTVSDLCRGDHIIYQKQIPPQYRPTFESAIVEEVIVNSQNGAVVMIKNDIRGVQRECYGFDELFSQKVHKVEYTVHRRSADDVVKCAKQRLDWGEKCYCTVSNNSHHFATFAKAGREYPLTNITEELSYRGK